jgi:hypothetical protein
MEEEVLVTDFLDVEETTTDAHVRVTDIFNTVDDRCSYSTSDTIVIGFPNSSNRRHIRLDKVMLGKI